ncbi:hypothetical protein BU25DRAFT_406727 [Macroventuria anomochaeta]|uniref:Uncharacterized protein n=1 Tax=Macroventuria anomochaeta TaxID=301207 RepID=A0ACB6SDS7_9PLEO|nr:uncharacterized protein BU25DRAFT_406727 [Macroventuria anomochaeta]KAF2632194.1 hypothetical protein BU25DRAFT_406727 [Macroventuria anomochaeta]
MTRLVVRVLRALYGDRSRALQGACNNRYIFNKNVKLRHVHLDIHDTEFQYDPRTNASSVVRISNSSVPPPLEERAYLWPLQYKIKSLSLNDGDFVEGVADEDMRAGYGPSWNTSALQEFHEICCHFKKLQQSQLSRYRAPVSDMSFPIWICFGMIQVSSWRTLVLSCWVGKERARCQGRCKESDALAEKHQRRVRTHLPKLYLHANAS